MKQIKRILLAASTLSIAATLTEAAVYTWTGSIDTDWSNSSNWDGNGIPPVDANGSLLNAANSVVISNGSFSPLANLPTLPIASSESSGPPLFDIRSGASLSLTGFSHQIAFPAQDKEIISVASGGSLTIATATASNSEIFMSRGGGTQTLSIAGTLNFNAVGFHMGYQSGRNTIFNLDGGTVNLTASNIFGARNNVGDFTSQFNQVNLSNGSTWDASGAQIRNTVGTLGGVTMVVDIQDVNSSFVFAKGRDFGSLTAVTDAFGTVFISSVLGNGSLQVVEDANVFTVTAVPEPATTTLLSGIFVLAAIMIRRRIKK